MDLGTYLDVDANTEAEARAHDANILTDHMRAMYGRVGYTVYDRPEDWDREHARCQGPHERRITVCVFGQHSEEVQITICKPTHAALVVSGYPGHRPHQ
jgi:hypothetical protein